MRVWVIVSVSLLVGFTTFGTAPAFGAAASITSSEYTGPNEITIVFDVPVDWVIGDFTGLTHDFTSPSTPSIISIAEVSPSAVVTITFGGTAVFPDETGTIDVASMVDAGSGNTFAGSSSQVLSDGQDPTIELSPIGPHVFFQSSFTVFFEEDIVDNSVTPGDFTVSGIASTPTVISVAFSSDAATFGLDNSITTSDTNILLSYTQSSGTIDDLAGNSLQDFSNLSVLNAAPLFEIAITQSTTSILAAFDTDMVNATITASDFTVAGNTVTGVTFDSPGAYILTLGTSIATNATPLVSLVGSVTDVIGFIQTSDSIVPEDGIGPTMDSAAIDSSNTIAVTFSEDLDDSTVDASDFTVSGLSVLAASETSAGIVTLTLSGDVVDTVTISLVDDIADAVFSNNFATLSSLDLIVISEGSVENVNVGAGGTASFAYSETEQETTETVSLAVTLPAGQAGTITVGTADEDSLESGTTLATAADITGPCTNTCTIQFIVPNPILTAAGLTSDASIYHDSNENRLLEDSEELVTSKDTTAIPGSTIFTATADFTSAFGVGGKSGSAGAASGNEYGKCDSSAFGRGESIRVYEISYDMCEIQQLNVTAKSFCGPANLSVLYEGGMTRGGLSMIQPYLDEDKSLLTAPISQDYNKFRVLVENDRSYYDKLIIPQKLHGLITECQKTIIISHDTGYLSNQTNSFTVPSEPELESEPEPESQPEKISPRKTVTVDEIPMSDTFFESENIDVKTTTLVYDPEPCVDTWDDSCVIVDPEPCVDTWDDSCVIVDPEPCVDTWDDSCKDDDKLYFLNWVFDFFSH